MQNHSYLAAYLAYNPSSASALLSSPTNSMELSSATGDNSSNLLASAFGNQLDSVSRSAILNQLLLQQRMKEEQQMALLIAQQVTALTGSNTPLFDNVTLLALLRTKLQQDQQAFQQSQLQELQSRIDLLPLLKSAPQYKHHPGAASASVDQSSEDFAAAGLRGLAKATLAKEQDDKKASPIKRHHGLVSPHSECNRKGRTGKFPQKLHRMLCDLERQGRDDIASFTPHGRSFAIHKPTEFVKEVMDKYFRMSRFSSFQRQLNLYDFQRITDGEDKGSYYHEHFSHRRPDVCVMMKRNKIKGEKQQHSNGRNRSII